MKLWNNLDFKNLGKTTLDLLILKEKTAET